MVRTTAISTSEIRRFVRQRLERLNDTRWSIADEDPEQPFVRSLEQYLTGKATAYRDVLNEIERLEET